MLKSRCPFELRYIALLTLTLGAVALLAITSSISPAHANAASQPGPPPFTSHLLTPISTATPTPNCTTWQLVTSPNPSAQDNALYGVEIIAPNDIWAVGYYQNSDGNAQTLTIHWDGNQWAQIPSPSPGLWNYLGAVSAISSNDIWAVGHQYTSASGDRTLTMHWDGSQWSTVPSPHPGDGSDYLIDVTTLPTGEVWAVGNYADANIHATRTLILRWISGQWQLVPSPDPGAPYGNSDLRGISAISNDDIWAVGYYLAQGSITHSLMTHWNGSQWDLVPSPDPRPQATQHFVQKVAAISTNDVWAVGNRNGSPDTSTLTMHWNGTEWSVVPSPNPHSQINYLDGIAGTAFDDVWAVGQRGGSTMVLHWDGSQWNLVPSPNYAQAGNALWAVSAYSRTQAWAVGHCQACLGSGSYYRTLTEQYTESCPPPSATPSQPPLPTASQPALSPTSILPTATATNITVSPTAIFTPIQTGTATPIPCTITFVDVPPDHTFYPYVHCLTCRGIISGYSDGTFKPNNNVTRGQLSKIVSNSAGFNEPVSGQTFSDVAPGSTFYEYIERMAHRGIIGGYSDGTFKPGNPATRGQISKIVSNARGYTDPPGAQIFEDVSPTNGFYEWIQRLASHGAMGGYNCGSPGEPCGPANRPYFRPANNATRGQTSKIVSSTFFPECNP